MKKLFLFFIVAICFIGCCKSTPDTPKGTYISKSWLANDGEIIIYSDSISRKEVAYIFSNGILVKVDTNRF